MDVHTRTTCFRRNGIRSQGERRELQSRLEVSPFPGPQPQSWVKYPGSELYAACGLTLLCQLEYTFRSCIGISALTYVIVIFKEETLAGPVHKQHPCFWEFPSFS
ncbi:hypothetical protein CapIbe_007452 [Capra ibex]